MLGKRFGVAVLAVATMACASARPEDDAQEASADELIGLSTPCEALSDVPGMTVRRESVDGGKVQLRIGVMDPDATPVADVLFFHGFADRFDNHLPLFEAWRDAGLRVVAFDYPSHGETCGRGIDRYKINGVAELVAHVERATRPDAVRPLVLAGWSTGGLLTIRLLQTPSIAPLSRGVAGAFLLAPGVDVPLVVGDHQRVTLETLTRNPDPPHRGAISPRSPLHTPFFAADLVLNSRIAKRSPYPKDVPTFVVTGGDDDDVYVRSATVRSWVTAQRQGGARFQGLSCDGARHELDNEPAPVGDAVRESASLFASWVASGARGATPTPRGCESY